MSRWTKRWMDWFFKIENEIMVPFISVGILVIAAFGAISWYSGYTMKMEGQKAMAQAVFDSVNTDLVYEKGRLSREEMAEKYKKYGNPSLRITDENGSVVAGPETISGNEQVILKETGGNRYGWTYEYILDMKEFRENTLEEMNLVIVGAVACLLIIVQVSVFLSWNLTKPIRTMSATCREIDRNRNDYRSYRFDAVKRRDEIGQLARTFEILLKNMDQYTKLEYTSRMSATLAHEIKNPLTGIRSGVQVLRGRVVKEGEIRLCDSMLHEIDRVTELINNLFTLSVKKENRKRVFPAEQFLSEMEVFYKGLEQQDISFQADWEKGLTVYGDENELRQVLHNLVTNSVKAMEKGRHGLVAVHARGLGDKVVFTVTDNGRGMSAEELERAREPFYTKSINGVGLGLAIVSRLVEKNLGTMDMESRPGEGLTVRLAFYRERMEHEEGTDH